jgi:carbamoyltransferase
MTTAALGRQWSDQQLAARLRTARLPFRTPADLAER